MSEFVKLYDITKEMAQLLEAPPGQEEERDEFIERLTELLDERGKLLSSFQREPADEEEKLLKHIIALQEKMKPKLEAELNSVKRDLAELKKKKETSRRYENPYSHTPIDGAFIDKKK
ncbi:flagellar protein FliT [Evansella caseinilytica]|uniref:Flagellar protein FliT n=1 Tax=Evansella caseinilytica TaxID=1503961 RepID=A0A1H3S6S9_9BACI|nr:hypothetical protein [Evansella caseinilytica]SDZ33823.1 flagellar protein FliT [Evansella caseinilytica]